MSDTPKQDCEIEPIPGLPEELPEGENILWQGRPKRASILRNVLHLRKFAFYFLLVLIWNVATAIYDGGSTAQVIGAFLWSVGLAAVLFAMGWWLSHVLERTTIYTITTKRVVMRFGIALPIAFNFPFSQILSADAASYENGHGIIALRLKEHTKISWPVLWPHARPWKLAKPEPALRGIDNVAQVAQILGNALREADGQDPAQVVLKDRQRTPTKHSAGGVLRPTPAATA